MEDLPSQEAVVVAVGLPSQEAAAAAADLPFLAAVAAEVFHSFLATVEALGFLPCLGAVAAEVSHSFLAMVAALGFLPCLVTVEAAEVAAAVDRQAQAAATAAVVALPQSVRLGRPSLCCRQVVPLLLLCEPLLALRLLRPRP